MGRQIRRVPADWEHPKALRSWRDHRETFVPLLAYDFDEVCQEYYNELALWQAGEHADQKKMAGVDLTTYFGKTHKPEYARIEDYKFYHEWAGDPPGPRTRHMGYHIAGRECTHWQLYENVSEGTPVSPVFATHEELVAWMRGEGEMSDWACDFLLKTGSCPTMIGAGPESSSE